MSSEWTTTESKNKIFAKGTRWRRIPQLSYKRISWKDTSWRLPSDPPENCHLTVKKLPKTWHFFKNNCQKFSFFSNGNFPEGQVITTKVTLRPSRSVTKWGKLFQFDKSETFKYHLFREFWPRTDLKVPYLPNFTPLWANVAHLQPNLTALDYI